MSFESDLDEMASELQDAGSALADYVADWPEASRSDREEMKDAIADVLRDVERLGERAKTLGEGLA